jgi:SagB-type dehydrogenase family enzyme
MKNRIGDEFQQETKYLRGKMPAGSLNWLTRPKTYKTYPHAPKVELGLPLTEGGMPLFEAIIKRRSVRDYRDQPLKKSDLSQLLWASQGITLEAGGYELRAAPSAGALYPVETYLSIQDVEGIEPGLYHYDVRSHGLEQLQAGDFRRDLAEAALEQDFIVSASAVFIWTGLFQRSKWKYKERAYRYVYLDAGHIAQNIALGAVALGLGSCQIAALYDDEVNALIGVDGVEESILYMTSVGHP